MWWMIAKVWKNEENNAQNNMAIIFSAVPKD